eukprot:scaffold140249_cov21-Tisochrysis_lutea.AAC.1
MAGIVLARAGGRAGEAKPASAPSATRRLVTTRRAHVLERRRGKRRRRIGSGGKERRGKGGKDGDRKEGAVLR